MTHDTATCGLCRLLAEGKTHTGAGHVEISPLCGDCGLHHFDSYPCPAKKVARSICPKCRDAKRVLQDIPESGQWGSKTYGPFCETCMYEEGYVLTTQTIQLQPGPYAAAWWTKPLSTNEQEGIEALAAKRMTDVFANPERPTVSPYVRGKRGLRV